MNKLILCSLVWLSYTSSAHGAPFFEKLRQQCSQYSSLYNGPSGIRVLKFSYLNLNGQSVDRAVDSWIKPGHCVTDSSKVSVYIDLPNEIMISMLFEDEGGSAKIKTDVGNCPAKIKGVFVNYYKSNNFFVDGNMENQIDLAGRRYCEALSTSAKSAIETSLEGT